MNVGDNVKVLSPFDRDYPGVYTVEQIVEHPDGQIVLLLSGAGGFAPQYLEVV